MGCFFSQQGDSPGADLGHTGEIMGQIYRDYTSAKSCFGNENMELCFTKKVQYQFCGRKAQMRISEPGIIAYLFVGVPV